MSQMSQMSRITNMGITSTLILVIFNCENNKLFITHSQNSDVLNGCPFITIFVDKYFPDLNTCDFIKNNKIISIKEMFIHDKTRTRKQNYNIPEVEKICTDIIFENMQEYGINNVRGITYIELNFDKFQYQAIRDELKKRYGSENIINYQPNDEKLISNIPDIEIALADLNKMSYFDKILNFMKDFEQINFSLVNLLDQLNDNDQRKIQLITKNPILSKLGLYSQIICSDKEIDPYLMKFLDKPQQLRLMCCPQLTLPILDLTTQYLNLKTKLKFFKSELKKLENKYESINNLQRVINDHLENQSEDLKLKKQLGER
jgi:hypothetical protein